MGSQEDEVPDQDPEESGSAGQPDQRETAREREAADLKHRLIISDILSVPVVLLSIVPALQYTHWQWAVVTMDTPLDVWCGTPFHKATLVILRHGPFTTDTQ